MRNIICLTLSILFFTILLSCTTVGIHKKAKEYNLKAVELINQGNYEMAERSLEIALEYNKNYAEAYNNLGIIYLRQNKLNKAEEFFSVAIEYNGDFAEAHNNLGYVYMLEGRTNKAEQRFKSALNIDPSFVNARVNLARLYILDKRYEEAESQLKKLRLISSSEEVYSLLINVYIRTNKINKAFELVDEMIESKEYSTKGYYLRGYLNLTLNRCNDAISDFRKVEREYENSIEFLTNLSASFICKKDYENGKIVLKKVLMIQPDEPAALFNLGKIAYENNDYIEAERYFDRSYKSGFVQACPYLVDVLFHNGKKEESMKISEMCK